jgi:hypothetical protein
MRNLALIKILIISSIFISPSCVSGVAIGESEPDTTPDDLSATDKDPDWIEEVPHEITEEQLVSTGQVNPELLPCGLAILPLSDHTDYWIRNCFEHDILGQLVTVIDEEQYISEEHEIVAHGLVSGSVRGRVLRFRRRR